MNTRILLYVACFVVGLSSCKSSQKMVSNPRSMPQSVEYAADKVEAVNKAKTLNTTTERKVTYNASIDLKVEENKGVQQQVEQLAKQCNGYLQSGSESYLELKIPSDSLNPIIEQIANLGEITHQNVYTNDVTEASIDLQLRLDNAKKARDRYLELLNMANVVSEILLIERELERLNYDIERLQGILLRLDRDIQYATLYVSIRERVKPGPIGYLFVGLWKGIKFLFVRN